MVMQREASEWEFITCIKKIRPRTGIFKVDFSFVVGVNLMLGPEKDEGFPLLAIQ